MCCYKGSTIIGQCSSLQIGQVFAYRAVKELLLTKPKNQVKRICIWQFKAFQQRDEPGSSTVGIIRCFTALLFGFWFLVFKLVKVIIFVRLPEAVKKS